MLSNLVVSGQFLVMLTNRLTQESKAVNTLKETAKMTKAKYKVNSFFAGIGGFDLGFENQGFQTEYLCEINPFCNEVL